jgi:hypothetical protein
MAKHMRWAFPFLVQLHFQRINIPSTRPVEQYLFHLRPDEPGMLYGCTALRIDL